MMGIGSNAYLKNNKLVDCATVSNWRFWDGRHKHRHIVIDHDAPHKNIRSDTRNESGIAAKPSTGLSKSRVAENVDAPAKKIAENAQKRDAFRAAFRAEMVKLNGGKIEDYSDL